MSPVVLALVVTAAFAHAAWNFLAKGAQGGAAFTWLASVAGAVIYLPALVIVLAVGPGRLGWLAIGLMAGSGALHAVYFIALQRGYASGDLSIVYPLGRGTGALLATTGAIVLLGERPSALAVAGAGIIVLAVFSLIARPQEPGAVTASGSRFALLTGVAIASYTLWDKNAVGPGGLTPRASCWSRCCGTDCQRRRRRPLIWWSGSCWSACRQPASPTRIATTGCHWRCVESLTAWQASSARG